MPILYWSLSVSLGYSHQNKHFYDTLHPIYFSANNFFARYKKYRYLHGPL